MMVPTLTNNLGDPPEDLPEELRALWTRWAAQCAEWRAIRDELLAARGDEGEPLSTHAVSVEQRKRAMAEGRKLVTMRELRNLYEGAPDVRVPDPEF